MQNNVKISLFLIREITFNKITRFMYNAVQLQIAVSNIS